MIDMNVSTVAKVASWGQFLLTAIGAAFQTVPTGIPGWISVIASLGIAIAGHAASSTDGAK
jgi:hypothetical protein